MGRKKYDAVREWGDDYLHDLENVRKIIISRSRFQPMKGFALANSPEDALQQLASEGFSEAIITGGATINSEFAKRGLIDEIILDINPSIVGQGLPIFAPQDFQLQLELLNVEKIGKELIEIRYRVVKAES